MTANPDVDKQSMNMMRPWGANELMTVVKYLETAQA
jgi:hypothetical protein